MSENPTLSVVHAGGPFSVRKIANATEALQPGATYEKRAVSELGPGGKDLFLCVNMRGNTELLSFIIDWFAPPAEFYIDPQGQWHKANPIKGVKMKELPSGEKPLRIVDESAGEALPALPPPAESASLS
jgi:hypothetical protein